MPRDLGIAARIRAKGRAFDIDLTVNEVAGWQTRGSANFDAVGSLDHHTASGQSTMHLNIPSLGVLINGHGNLPGPLCNVGIARDNTVYVIAAGRANHGGTGHWGGRAGNSKFYGVERENVGYGHIEPWRWDQTIIAGLVHAALIEGRAGADMVARHAEYATPPGRKIDTHTIHGDELRGWVQYFLNPPPQPNPFPPTLTDRLTPGDMLHGGQHITSANGRYALAMQADGNLVVYESQKALWSSATHGQGAHVAIMQGDGNLVLYAPEGRAVWATGTHGNPGTLAVMQDDGNLVLYGPGNRPLWDSNGFTRPDDLAAVAAAIARAKTKVLRQGSIGEEVWWLQVLLNQRLDSPHIVTDAYFGAATTDAVKRFQRNIRDYFGLGSKMAVDGIVGPTTWYWLTL